ncbi:NAD(P)/FAD-dependent oxidoreductase [Actinocorallia sp. B10E7]|uniref:flavin monoamine oxidase family protein n=1 Tax=Actinocorallia sp. B10E7 TaxID=3153558 RepID=UPI00325F23CF
MRNQTPITARIRRILAAHAEADRTGVPVSEVLAAQPARPARRDVLRAAAALGAGAAALSLPARPARAAAAAQPRIAIVGAGLAGVRAAHWLYRVKGLTSTIYEASNRAGGRCYSLRGLFGTSNDLVVEHGGAFINTEHNLTRNLATTLGLNLRVVNGGNDPAGPDTYWMDGARYSYDAANADWGVVQRKFKDALAAAPWCQTFDDHTAAGVALDSMSVDEWLDANIPGGLSSRFARLMQSNAVVEYGMDPGDQSALNLIYLLGWNSAGSLDPLTGGDEKYVIDGGNDQLISAMLAELPAGTVNYGRRLTAVSQSGTTATLTFDNGGSSVDVVADQVILALPFTTLRDCDLTGAGLSALKLRAIQEMNLGSNGKIHVGLSNRPWVSQGYGGTTYSAPGGWVCAWDDTANSGRTDGVMCQFPGGTATTGAWTGAAFGTAPASQVTSFLNQVDQVFPGTAAAYDGRSYRSAWHLNPWSKGSYTCPQPGQYTSLFGVEARTEGVLHFAGEHTSVEYFGFLNGAVESGERAAKEIAGVTKGNGKRTGRWA